VSASDAQRPKRLEVRFALLMHPDTLDYNEARADAEALIQMCKESWYTPIRLDSHIRVIEKYDDER
jgi:hypothetical protein